MTSRDISEKYPSQNAMNMKLGQDVLGETKIRNEHNPTAI